MCQSRSTSAFTGRSSKETLSEGNVKAAIQRIDRVSGLKAMLGKAVLLCAIVSLSGCSTLSSFGLPFNSANNAIVKSAKQISELPGQALQLPSELAKQPLDVYLVEVGDSIFIEPVSFDATLRLPGDQAIRPDGTISLGEFGRYAAVNKTIDQIQIEVQSIIDSGARAKIEQEFAEERIRDRKLDNSVERPDFEKQNAGGDSEFAEELEREQQVALEKRISEVTRQNRVSVRLVNWDSKKIYVLGEVNSPGFFNYSGNQTVLDAILEAGGLTGKANHHQIIVARPTPCGSCRVVMKVCYDHVVQLGDTSTNYQLLPGDRVFVPSLTFIEDVKKTLSFNRDPACPRCASDAVGCQLPEGCQ